MEISIILFTIKFCPFTRKFHRLQVSTKVVFTTHPSTMKIQYNWILHIYTKVCHRSSSNWIFTWNIFKYPSMNFTWNLTWNIDLVEMHMHFMWNAQKKFTILAIYKKIISMYAFHIGILSFLVNAVFLKIPKTGTNFHTGIFRNGKGTDFLALIQMNRIKHFVNARLFTIQFIS
jgi:hypothetical protein